MQSTKCKILAAAWQSDVASCFEMYSCKMLAVLRGSFFVFIVSFWSSLAADEGWSNRVYLTSYPRAGNHWVRYLVEEATGIATSSVYCDQADREYERKHLPAPFPWGYCPDHGFEGNRRYPGPSDVVLLKTHFPVYPAEAFDNKPYKRAVCLIRHPVDCFYAQYLKAPPNGRVSGDLIETFLTEYVRYYEHWGRQPYVTFIRYEDLYHSPVSVFTKILTASGIRVKDGDIRRAVNRYPPRGGTYKYASRLDSRDVALIESRLADLLRNYNYTRSK